MPSGFENPLVLWLVVSAAIGGLAHAFLRQELRLRATLYGAFLAACVVATWPPTERVSEDGKTTPGKIRLGLDLRGGLHLVMQVKTDDALNAVTDDGAQWIRDQATRRGIQVKSAQRRDARTVVVDGVEPARFKDARDMLRERFSSLEWTTDERESEGMIVAGMTDP